MSDNIIHILENFKVNTDAQATNQGFFYQYLVTLDVWLRNYNEENDVTIYCETEDDIKIEEKDTVEFTQVKAYASDFTFKAKEIQKSIVNFFLLYLEYEKYQNKSTTFIFHTTSSFKKDFLDKIKNESEVKKLLIKKFYEKKEKKTKKKEVEEAYTNLEKIIENDTNNFLEKITWHGEETDKDNAINKFIESIETEISKIEGFKTDTSSAYAHLIKKVLIASQAKNIEDRRLDRKMIDDLIEEAEDIDKFKQGLQNAGLLLKFHKICKKLDIQIEALDNISKEILPIKIEPFLKKKYKEFENVPLLLDTNKSKPINKFIINLEYKERENKEIIQIDKMLEEHLNQSSKILIYGEAGIGKTSLCKYIAYRWLENKFTNFKYVIYIPLRVWESKGLQGAIKDYYFDEEESRKLEDIENKSEDILFLFDGYDELREKKKVELKKLVTKLENYIIVSRPSPSIKNDFEINKIYENTGFLPENIDSYIDSFFDLDTHKSSLKEFFRQNRNMASISYIPIMLEIICFLWEEKTLEDNITRTELYNDVVESLLKHDSKDKNLHSCLRKNKIKKSIGKLAFHGLKTQTILFDCDFLTKRVKDKEIDFFEEVVAKSSLLRSENPPFEFPHLTFQEYFSAYYINSKKIKPSKIRKRFAFKYKFYSKFEDMIIYLTNMSSKYADKFIDFDPFIFREHPSLTKELQEKLLLSIIGKLQHSEYLVWNREDILYNTTLTKFDKIDDIYSLIKDKNIEDSQSDILFAYIIKVFAKNYSKGLEKFIFEMLSNIKDKNQCRKFISHSYNSNREYNIRLLNFIKRNKLYIENSNKIDSDTLSNSFMENEKIPFIKPFFNILFKLDKNSSNFKEVTYLLNIIDSSMFEEIILLIAIDDIKSWFRYIIENDKYEVEFPYYSENLMFMLKIILESKNDFLDFQMLKNILLFFQKNKINTLYFEPSSLSFKSIHSDFWTIYFSDEIQDFNGIKSFLNMFKLEESDIEEMQKRFSPKDYSLKIYQILVYDSLILEKEQLDEIVLELNKVENFEKYTKLIKSIFELFKDNYPVFRFIQENNLLQNNKKIIDKLNMESFENIADKLFPILYKEKEAKELLPYISLKSKIIKEIETKYIQEWVDYFCKNYNENLFEKNPNYNKNIGLIAYELLTRDNLNILVEEVIILLQKVKYAKSYSLSESASKNIWKIYFSKDTNGFEKELIYSHYYAFSFAFRSKKEEIFVKYPIEEYLVKYYNLDIYHLNNKYSKKYDDKNKRFKNVSRIKVDLENLSRPSSNTKFSENNKYKDFIEIKSKNYDENREKNNEVKEYFKKLKKIELYNKYSNSSRTQNNTITDVCYEIESIVKEYTSLDTRYGTHWIFNYIFDTLNIAFYCELEEDCRKYFWCIILNRISIESVWIEIEFKEYKLLKFIEDEFDLLIEVVKEYIEEILKEKPNTCIKASCENIINIFREINLKEQPEIWNEFLKYLEIKKENSAYKDFFESIEYIPYDIDISLKYIENNKNISLEYIENKDYHFDFIWKKDMNKALEYFYEYIYKPIPYNSKRPSQFSSSLKRSTIIYSSFENKIYSSNYDIKTICRDTNSFDYFIDKIILFDKLLNQIGNQFGYRVNIFKDKDYKKLKPYIEKILIDYNNFFNKKESNRLIREILIFLQKDKEKLEEFKKSDNKYISNLAKYYLLQIYDKK